MDKLIWGILALLIFASPFIALIIIAIVKVRSAIRKRKQAKATPENIGVGGDHQNILIGPTVKTQQIKDTNEDISNAEQNPPVSSVKAFILFLGAILITIFGGSVAGITAAAVGSIFYIALIFPLVMGFAGGFILTAAIQLATVRKTTQLIFMALLVAVSIYGTYQYGRYFALQLRTSLEMFSGLTPAMDEDNLKVAKAVVDYALEQETGRSGFVGYMLFKAKQGVSIGRFYSSNRLNLGPILTWVYWLLEFGIILWLTTSIGKKETLIPVCNACGNPYGREKHLGGVVNQKESILLDLIKRRIFVEAATLIEENADLPSTELYVQGCEKCKKGTSQLIVRRAYRGARGTLQFTDVLQIALQPTEKRLLSQQQNP